jgi:hypothetical protein
VGSCAVVVVYAYIIPEKELGTIFDHAAQD